MRSLERLVGRVGDLSSLRNKRPGLSGRPERYCEMGECSCGCVSCNGVVFLRRGGGVAVFLLLLLFLVYHLLITVLVERRALSAKVFLSVLLVALTRLAFCFLPAGPSRAGYCEFGRWQTLGACQGNSVGGLIVRDGKICCRVASYPQCMARATRHGCAAAPAAIRAELISP